MTAMTVCVTPGRLSLLGNFELSFHGEPVALPPSGQRLLAFLGLYSSTDRHTTAGKLWPDPGDERASGSLRSALSKLQRLCPQAVVNGGRRLSVSNAITVDAVE